MPDLRFSIEGAGASPSAATPQLLLKLGIATDEPIHSIVLRCQVQIDPARRRYAPAEEALLHDLFGERARWGETLRALPWAQPVIAVPSFEGSTLVDVPLVCSVDVTTGPAKYLFALETGEVPLTVLMSGTVFYRGPGGLQVANIPWDREATHRLPVELVRRVAELHHSGAAFLSLRRDVFDRLHAYRLERGHPSWEHAIEALLARAETKAPL